MKKNIIILFFVIAIGAILTQTFLYKFMDAIVYGIFCLLFISEILSNLIFLFKMRSRLKINGKILDRKELIENSEKIVLYKIEFINPNNSQEVTIEHKTLLSNKLPQKQSVVVFFNDKNPQDAIVVDDTKAYYWIRIAAAGFLFILFTVLLIRSLQPASG